ncbi:hypothetical protein ACFL6Y_09240 [Elusimicrobiota bacterium]
MTCKHMARIFLSAGLIAFLGLVPVLAEYDTEACANAFNTGKHETGCNYIWGSDYQGMFKDHLGKLCLSRSGCGYSFNMRKAHRLLKVFQMPDPDTDAAAADLDVDADGGSVSNAWVYFKNGDGEIVSADTLISMFSKKIESYKHAIEAEGMSDILKTLEKKRNKMYRTHTTEYGTGVEVLTIAGLAFAKKFSVDMETHCTQCEEACIENALLELAQRVNWRWWIDSGDNEDLEKRANPEEYIPCLQEQE